MGLSLVSKRISKQNLQKEGTVAKFFRTILVTNSRFEFSFQILFETGRDNSTRAAHCPAFQRADKRRPDGTKCLKHSSNVSVPISLFAKLRNKKVQIKENDFKLTLYDRYELVLSCVFFRFSLFFVARLQACKFWTSVTRLFPTNGQTWQNCLQK